MKRFIALALAVFTLFSLVACKSDYENETESTNGTTEALTEEPIVYNTFDIADFSIVYHDVSFAPAVNVVKDAIQKKTGVELTILRDTKSAEYEIVVGNAERDIAKKFLESSYLLSDKYGYIVDGKSIYILGLTETLIGASADLFVKTYLEDGNVFEIESRAQFFLQVDTAALSMPQKPEGEDVIRFISNNILYQGLYADYDRAKEILTAYSLLRPDVVALQETDDIWREKTKLLEYMEHLGLEIVLSDERIESPLLYNTRTLKLIDSGFNDYDELAKYGAFRCYQWALFEQISTGKRFIALSTHFNSSAPAGSTMDESTFRTLSAKQAVKEVNELSQRLGAPIVFGGDFNSHLTSSSYHTLKTGFNSARECCKSVANMEYRTDNLIGYSPEKGTWCIDHVLYSKEGVNALHFETVISPLCYVYSDHVPITFDFTLE